MAQLNHAITKDPRYKWVVAFALVAITLFIVNIVTGNVLFFYGSIVAFLIAFARYYPLRKQYLKPPVNRS